MKQLIKYANLLDFYKSLFTKTQLKYLEPYFYEDKSLQEIADTFNVTRSAVYDIVKRCQKQLVSYEKKLHLFEKSKKD